MSVSFPKVLHCAHLVGGQATSLARAERLLGAQSRAVSWQPSVFGYPADEILWPEGAGLVTQEAARWRLLARAVRDFDVIHYNYGAPILNWGALDGRHKRMAGGLGGVYAAFNRLIELPLVKRMGRVVAVTYQGDDARQGDYCREHFDITFAREVDETYYSPAIDDAKRDRIARFDRHADLIYALNPDLLHVLPERAKFLPYAHIDLDAWSPVQDNGRPVDAPPLLVHAPSHRGVKGTRYMLEALERLRQQGVAFELQLVEGLTQSEARRVYERADLVLDQLLAGWYGGFAVEVMALGKPVICYLRHSDFGFLPEGMAADMPIIDASPLNIEAVLRDWLTRPRSQRIEQGLKGRRYVERWHNPGLIAARLLTDYRRALQARQPGA